MKLHNAWPFTRWLFGRMFGGVARLYGKYDKMVCEDTGLAFMPTMMIALVSIVPTFIIFSVLGIVEYSIYGWLVVAVLVVANYFRIVLREQYKKFSQERREFLDGFKGEQ
jgi:Flp pilus assembly protein TadB